MFEIDRTQISEGIDVGVTQVYYLPSLVLSWDEF